MSDLIRREDAIRVVEGYFEKILELNPDICLDGLRSLPTVDAVPVIRCRDCVKFDARYGICNEDTWSSGSDGYAPCVRSDDFCSFSERRTDAQLD